MTGLSLATKWSFAGRFAVCLIISHTECLESDILYMYYNKPHQLKQQQPLRADR